MSDEAPRAPEPAAAPTAAQTPAQTAAPKPTPKRARHAEFFGALFAVFVFGWAASYLGSARGIDWLYFTGLTFVGLPLLVLMAWLGH